MPHKNFSKIQSVFIPKNCTSNSKTSTSFLTDILVSGEIFCPKTKICIELCKVVQVLPGE